MHTALPLFVYGTLMSDQPAFGLFAAASLRFVRAQLPNARLYSVGPYPIAAEGGDVVVDHMVYGEVHWLVPENQPLLLQQLDLYEGDEYVRVRRRVLLAGGGETEAWVYLGNQIYAAQYQQIPSGDWRRRGNPC